LSQGGGREIGPARQPPVAFDPVFGPFADRRRVCARLFPLRAQRRQLLEPSLPFCPKNLRKETAEAPGQGGAAPAGRDRDQKIAPAHHGGRVKIAELRPVLDVDQRAGGARGRDQIGERARLDPVGDQQQLGRSDLGGCRPSAD